MLKCAGATGDLAIVAITRGGKELALRLAVYLMEQHVADLPVVYLPDRLASPGEDTDGIALGGPTGSPLGSGEARGRKDLSEALVPRTFPVDLAAAAGAGGGHTPGAVVQLLPQAAGRREVVCASYRGSLGTLVQGIFRRYRRLVFIMSCGIVVRLIAPHLKDKWTDPAVVVLDEAGNFAVPLLSGHWGGANRLSNDIAEAVGAKAVVTTASETRGLIAPEVMAADLGWEVEPAQDVKQVSVALVNGQTVALYLDHGLPSGGPRGNAPLGLGVMPSFRGGPFVNRPRPGDVPPGVVELWTRFCSQFVILPFDELDRSAEERDRVNPQAVVLVTNRVLRLSLGTPCLFLRPKNLVVGVGCRRGVSARAVMEAIEAALAAVGRARGSVRTLASITRKRDEPGLREAAAELKVPLVFFEAGEISTQVGRFRPSKMVRQKIGVDGVCEPAALLASRGGQLILPKRIQAGVTVAVVEENYG